MRLREIKKLHRGDQVYWVDPDNGTCSRLITILTIRASKELVQIVDLRGGYLECFPRELKDPNENWKNDKIQFPRLIAELEAVGAFTDEVMLNLASEMDLDGVEICDIIHRAQIEWEKIKAKTVKGA